MAFRNKSVSLLNMFLTLFLFPLFGNESCSIEALQDQLALLTICLYSVLNFILYFSQVQCIYVCVITTFTKFSLEEARA